MLPMTMPGASLRTISQRTAPRLWWARTLEMDVKMITAMDVAIAILTVSSLSTPWEENMKVRKGTRTMPPPIPRSPARKPLPIPSRSSRSEEHTSELQSLMRISYAVFCLKKKKTTNINKQNQSEQTYNITNNKHT